MSMPADIGAILKRLARLEDKVAQLQDLVLADPAAVAKGKKESVKEFILSKSPKTEVDKALAVGYYLENREKFDSFNISDLEAQFRLAKEPVPKNVNDVVNKNIAKGFMMEHKERKDNKKAWVLTSTGEKAVEGAFE